VSFVIVEVLRRRSARQLAERWRRSTTIVSGGCDRCT